MSRTFVSRSARRLTRSLQKGLQAEDFARRDGFLQKLDARCKIIGLLVLVGPVSAARGIRPILVFFALALLLMASSQIPVRAMAKRVWLGVLALTGTVALPALFVVPGRPWFTIPILSWTVTVPGFHSALLLVVRIETVATLSALLVLSTPWMQVLRGLRVLRIPVIAVVMLAMTYRYIVLLLRTASEMFEARESRSIGLLDGPARRRLAGATAGVLLSKSVALSEEIYLAMLSRGFTGEVYTFDNSKWKRHDSHALAGAFLVSAAGLALG